ncbi:thioredoxin family protein [Kordiimonas lacus]|uniref:Thioredoxin domain-containing protein n=1 Tax=Kordiimonas lacus TaxID=637679 RepID=A0A1G6WM74_9PROT|nr:thioredoxin family protein [Kordiimonas lacus]SDD66186.1 Thioredoxin domain-containing protein [Kordiimonas lacus]
MTKPVIVELLTASGCNRCRQTRDRIRFVVADWPEGSFDYREVNVVEEIDYAVKLEVLSTPSVAIDGVLAFTGPPSEKKLHQALRDALDKRNTHAPLS